MPKDMTQKKIDFNYEITKSPDKQDADEEAEEGRMKENFGVLYNQIKSYRPMKFINAGPRTRFRRS